MIRLGQTVLFVIMCVVCAASVALLVAGLVVVLGPMSLVKWVVT